LRHWQKQKSQKKILKDLGAMGIKDMRFESGRELGGVQTMSLDLTVIIGYMTPSASMPASPPASICFPSIF
jgi:hypothetical protein